MRLSALVGGEGDSSSSEEQDQKRLMKATKRQKVKEVFMVKAVVNFNNS
jgi:hypothetical protein